MKLRLVLMAVIVLMSRPSIALTIGQLDGRVYFGQNLNLSLLISTAPLEKKSDLCLVVKLIGDAERPVEAVLSNSFSGQSSPQYTLIRIFTRQKIEDMSLNLSVQVGCQGVISRDFVILPEIASAIDASEEGRRKSVNNPSSMVAMDLPIGGSSSVGLFLEKSKKIPSDSTPKNIAINNRKSINKIENFPEKSQKTVLKIDWLSDPFQEHRVNPVLRLSGELGNPLIVRDSDPPADLSVRSSVPMIWIMDEAEISEYVRKLSADVAVLTKRTSDLGGLYAREQADAEVLRDQFKSKEKFYILVVISLLIALIWSLVVILLKRRNGRYQMIVSQGDVPVGGARVVTGGGDNASFLSKMLRQRFAVENPEQLDSIFSPNAYLPDRKSSAVASTLQDASLIESDFLASGFSESINSIAAEDLFDLQQQVEFFISINQKQKAIDILVARISCEGPISPLPYLDLLRLYHDTGDSIEYEKLRSVFSQKYAAVVPHFSDYSYSRRGLQRYRATILSLQELWPTPAVVTFIEDNLFQSSNATIDLDVIDLEAYRELLLLYGIARMIYANSDGVGGATGYGTIPSASTLNAGTGSANRVEISRSAEDHLLRDKADIDVNLDDIIEGTHSSNDQSKPSDQSLDYYVVDFLGHKPKDQ